MKRETVKLIIRVAVEVLNILSVLQCNVKDIKNGDILEKKTPKLDSRFIKSIDGKDFALYSGLLDLAHQKGLLKIEVEAIQYPTKENEHLTGMAVLE